MNKNMTKHLPLKFCSKETKNQTKTNMAGGRYTKTRQDFPQVVMGE